MLNLHKYFIAGVCIFTWIYVIYLYMISDAWLTSGRLVTKHTLPGTFEFTLDLRVHQHQISVKRRSCVCAGVSFLV